MRRRIGLGFALAALGLCPTGAWALSGTFLDNTGAALEGAAVSLVNQGLSTTTDANGYFSFEVASIGSSLQVYGQPTLVGNQVYFTATTSTRASVVLYSIDGARLGQRVVNVSAGSNAIELPEAGGRHRFAVAHFSAGGVQRTFRCILGSGFRSGSASNATLLLASASAARTAATSDSAVDTLVVKKSIDGVTSTRKLLVWGYQDSVNTYIDGGQQILILDESNDNDADGLTNYEERYTYNTNAEIADTDGDGVDDYAEIKDATDPLISNLPEFSFAMTAYPVIVANYSKTIGSSNTKEISSGGEYSTSSTFSAESQASVSLEQALEFGVEFSETVNTTGGEASSTQHFTSTTTFGASISSTLGTEWSESSSSNWSEATSTASSADATISGGSIKVRIKFTNRGDVGFNLLHPHIVLAATGYDLDNMSTQIGELSLDDIEQLQLNAKDTVSAIFSVTIDNADLIENLATRTTGLVAQLSNYEIERTGTATDTLMTNVYRRTTLVTVDPGWYATDTSVTKVHVAKRNLYNDFYTSQLDRYQGNTLYGILKIAGDVPTLDSTNGRYGIRSIRGLANGDFLRGSWGVVVQKTSDSIKAFSPSIASYNPKSISVDTTAYVSVVFSADRDADGLPGRIEDALGTSDTLWDTDDDGLSDSAECAGWNRDGEDTLWITDPRLYDTDGDALPDSSDIDPLTAQSSADDSTIGLTGIVVASLQGSSWSPTSIPSGTNDTLKTTSIVRGPGTLTLTFSHPVKKILLARVGGDSVTASTPDDGTTASYTLSLPLELGSNTLDLTIYSKNGATCKLLQIAGLQRRLARLAAVDSILSLSMPSYNLRHKASIVTVNVAKARAIDPLISSVYLFKTRTYAAPVTSSDSTKARQADNLGDSGNATKNLVIGSVEQGKDGQANLYTLAQILTADAVLTDSVLNRDSDYVYFPYAASSDAAYLTAPSTVGAYYAPNRDIVIDSVVLSEQCLHNWGASANWKTILRGVVELNGSTFSNDAVYWLYAGDSASLTIAASGTLVDRDTLGLPNTNSQFVRLDLYTWLDNAILPLSLASYQITHPTTTIEGATGDDWVGNGTDWSYTTIDGYGISLFRNHIRVHWHYLIGS